MPHYSKLALHLGDARWVLSILITKIIKVQSTGSDVNKQGKTIKFIKRAALLWCALVFIGFLITMFANNLENTKTGNLLLSLNGIIFVLIFIIPIIMFLAIILKYAERMLDKISKSK